MRTANRSNAAGGPAGQASQSGSGPSRTRAPGPLDALAIAGCAVLLALGGAVFGGAVGLAGGALLWALVFVPLGAPTAAVVAWCVAGGCLIGAVAMLAIGLQMFRALYGPEQRP